MFRSFTRAQFAALLLRAYALILITALSACAPATSAEAPPANAAIPSTPVTDAPGWELIFQDEFEGDELDAGKWVRCYWWDEEGCTIRSNNEMQWYQPDNVRVEEGKLVLEARHEQAVDAYGEVFDYTSGMVSSGRPEFERSTAPGFAFQYGYAEIRAKVPKGQGLWSAFWLLPEYHRSRPEIDVLEILGHEPDTIKMFIHYDDEEGEGVGDGDERVGPDFSADWHTFGIDWSPNALVWYVDGEEYRRIDDPALISATQMYLIMNLAVGGDWPGAPDADTPFPSAFEIDYVRVWSRHTTTALTTVARATIAENDASLEPAIDSDATLELAINDDPASIVYLTFDTAPLDTAPLAATPIDSATLRLWVGEEYGTELQGDYAVYLVDGELLTDGLTFADRPPLAATPLATFHRAETDEIYDLRLDVAQLQPVMGEQVTLALVAHSGDPLTLVPEAVGVQDLRLTLTTPRLGPDGQIPVAPPAE